MKQKKLHGAKKKIALKVNKLLMTSLSEYFFSDFLSTTRRRRSLCAKAMTLAPSLSPTMSLFVTMRSRGTFLENSPPSHFSLLALRGHKPLIVMCFFNVSIEFDFFFAFSQLSEGDPGGTQPTTGSSARIFSNLDNLFFTARTLS